MRELIVDAAIEYVTLEDLVDELEAIVGWSDEHDIGLHRALKLARGEAADALSRLTALVRVLLSREVSDE